MFEQLAGIDGARFPVQTVPAVRHVSSLIEDARAGLLSRPRSIPAKYLYDERGSHLFDRICETRDYYPTRTEESLLSTHADSIVRIARPGEIFELGSGTSRKTRVLIDACEAAEMLPGYVAFDISEEAMQAGAVDLSKAYDWLDIDLLLGDYEGGFAAVPSSQRDRLFIFLGSTIGNFEHADAVAFLADLRDAMSPGDHLLLGADRVKSPDVLNAAYNDSAGLTEAFNLNMLRILNRTLDANFVVEGFEHRASYNEARERIEMHLVSKFAQDVHIGRLARDLRLDAAESIRTEISRKFTIDSLTKLLAESGFSIIDHFEAEDSYFSLMLAAPARTELDRSA